MKKPAHILAALLFPVLLTAQETGVAFKDFEYVKASIPWLGSKNVSSLQLLPVSGISTVRAGIEKTDGLLMDVHESGNSFKAGAYTESFVKVSDRISFYGRLSYSYSTGSGMGGPILMNPSYNFINFEESTDTTAGRKVKELYSLTGGVGYRLSGRWSIGGRAFYESGNCAKRKDPRFANSWTDIDFTGGVSFAPSGKVRFGLNGEFRKTVETVTAAIYGESAKTYYTIVDFGGYFGKREILESSDAYISTSSSSSKPLVNHFYGGSAQAEFLLSGDVRLFNEVAVLHRTGYYGSKSSGAVRFCDASGNTVEYKGVLSMLRGRNEHRISLDGAFAMLTNDENTYNVTTRPGESSEVSYLGSQQALDRKEASLSLGYDGKFNISGQIPELEAGAEAGLFHRTFTAESYPNYRRQTVSQLYANIYARRNYMTGKTLFRLSAEIGFLSGLGTKNDDGKKVSATGEAYSGTAYLDRNFEYMTAYRTVAKLGLKYVRQFGRLSVFAEASDSYTRLGKAPEYLGGRWRNTFLLSLGCDF